MSIEEKVALYIERFGFDDEDRDVFEQFAREIERDVLDRDSWTALMRSRMETLRRELCDKNMRCAELEHENARLKQEHETGIRLLRANIAVYRIYISKLESDLVKARAEQNEGAEHGE